MASTATTSSAGTSGSSSTTTTITNPSNTINTTGAAGSDPGGVEPQEGSGKQQPSGAETQRQPQYQQRAAGGPSRAGQGARPTMREYCLRWNNHQPNLVTFFGNLLNRESFVDVTLVSSEGRKLQAHKLVLSACSPYFQHVFENNPCKHPIVILKDVQYADLRTIVSFIYNGEVNISQDRINTILSTASTLQIKGLAEVPADELKRVGGPNKANSEEQKGRGQALPVRSTWASSEHDESYPQTEVPRKKLKKSTTNGDHSSSFESGVGASMSRSIDDGLGVIEGVPARGPPPLTAGSQLPQKSRSLDTGMAMKHEENANADSELSSGGFSESQTYDDSSLGADRGYDLEVADMKREGMSDDENEFDEELYDHPDNENLEFEPQSFQNSPSSSSLFFQPDRQFTTRPSVVPSPNAGRKRSNRNEPYLDQKFQDAVQLICSGRASILKAAKICGIPKSVTARRHGRPLMRQSRMNEVREPAEIAISGAGAGETSSGGIIHKNDKIDTKTSEEEKDKNSGDGLSIQRQQSVVPIVTVSGSSPTPPSSPSSLPLVSKESSITIIETYSGETQVTATSTPETLSAATSLLSIPSTIETAKGSGYTLVKQLSESQIPMSSCSSVSTVPHIKRQHSQPNPGEISSIHTARLLYPGMKPGDLFQIVPAQDESSRSESVYYVDSSFLQVIPAEPTSSRRISQTRELVKDMEIIRRDIRKETEGTSFDSNISIDEVGDGLAEPSTSGSSAEPVQRYGHCPALRPGPALGCNHCWGAVDKCGRILRRKTKYHCIECKINLCIVPCFQEYHEKGDKKKPKRNLLPKPSSM